MGMDGLAITPGALAEMITLIEGGTISGKIAKDVLPRLLDGEGNAGVKAFVEKEGLVQISGGSCRAIQVPATVQSGLCVVLVARGSVLGRWCSAAVPCTDEVGCMHD